jgi:hypothetical protein
LEDQHCHIQSPPLRAVLAAPLSPKSYVMHEFIGPKNGSDRKHPDTMNKGFRALLDNTQDTMHRMAIYSSTWEYIKNNSGNKTYISDEQLHAMELCI